MANLNMKFFSQTNINKTILNIAIVKNDCLNAHI